MLGYQQRMTRIRRTDRPSPRLLALGALLVGREIPSSEGITNAAGMKRSDRALVSDLRRAKGHGSMHERQPVDQDIT
jgi:hypothetical protein